MRYAIAAAVCLLAIGFALANADDEQDARVEFDVILSDTPLTVQNTANYWTDGTSQFSETQNFELGEHQANDLGTVLLIVIEKECGHPI